MLFYLFDSVPAQIKLQKRRGMYLNWIYRHIDRTWTKIQYRVVAFTLLTVTYGLAQSFHNDERGLAFTFLTLVCQANLP